MADNTQTINILVTDNGSTAKLNKEALKLKGSYEGVAAAARIPNAVAAARQGVGAANNARPGGAGDSNLTRGIAGQTGAAGRDFAAQAQGLGGLVHVYATFAANLFAISAAFGALSKAADTSNLVKGLDQLGAASGRSLGSLAKRLMEVTDSAISMKDALTATAQASAGGLTSANILRLGNVARQASQALGIAMPDAVSRLSRGITKLEPELLDEIGILVRVDKASADYARSIGKTASQLTDFEKRQGFANAVLEQGEKKFGAIKLDANPYAKIQSSMENLAYQGLNLINTVLSPVLKLLSTSPTALALAMAGIATILLKQALPALGQWRQGLVDSAAAASKAVIESNNLRKAQLVGRDADLYTKEEAAIARIGSAREVLNGINKKSALTNKLLKQDMSNVSKEQIEALEKQAAARSKFTTAQAKFNVDTLNRAHLEGLALQNLAKEYRAFYENRQKLSELETVKPTNRFFDYLSQDAARDRIASKLQTKARSAGILGEVASTLPVDGLSKSFSNLFAAVSNARKGLDSAGVAFTDGEKKMGRFAAASTAARGSVAILASGITTLAASLMNVFAIIGVITVVFQLLDGWLSTSGKAAESFSTSMDVLSDSAENASKTLDAIRAKSAEEVLSVESIQARANAFGDLSDSLIKASADFTRLQTAQSWWDKSWDAIKDGFGTGSADKLATNISKGIVASLKLIEEGPAKKAAQDTLSGLFGGKVDVTNPKELEKALRGLTDDQISVKANQIAKALEGISRTANNAASAVTNTKIAFGEIDKTINDIATSLKLTDNFAKLGSTAITAGADFNKALKDPTNALIVLNELVKDTQVLSILPPTMTADLIAAKAEIINTTRDLGTYKEALAKANEEQVKLDANVSKSSGGTGSRTVSPQALKDRNIGIANISELKRLIDKTQTNANNLVDAFSNSGNELFRAGALKLRQSLKGALEEGAITAARGYLSVIKGAGGQTAEQEGALRAEEINLQITAIKQQFTLIQTIERNSLKIEQNTIAQQILAAQADTISASEERRERGNKQLLELNKTQASLDSKGRLLGLSGKAATDAYTKAGVSGNEADTAAASQLGGYFQALFGQQGQLAKLIGSLAANSIQTKAAKIQEQTGVQTKTLSVETGAKTAESAVIGQQLSTLGYYDKQLADKKNILDISILTNNAIVEQLNTEAKISQLQLARGKGGNQKKLEEDITAAEKERATNLSNYTKNVSVAKSKQLADELSGLEAIQVKDRETAAIRLGFTNEIAKQDIAIQEAKLANSAVLGSLDTAEVTRQTATLDLAKQQLDYEKQIADVRKSQADAVGAVNVKIAAAGGAGSNTRLDTEKASILENNALQLSGIDKANEARKLSITLTSQQKAIIEDQATQMAKLVDLTSTLAGIFGQLGTTLGGVLQGIQKIADTETNYKTAVLDLEKKRQEVEGRNSTGIEDRQADAKKLIEINKAQGKLDSKNTKDQLTGLANIAGSVKSLFKEKTFAYKAFAAVEKAAHIVSLGIYLAENAAAIASLPLKIASGVATMFSQSGFGGFVGAAALLALMASLGFGGKGGVTGAPSAGFSAEEQQKVQGTGQQYNANGDIVRRSGGVLGDDTAIAKSIDLAISEVEAHTFKNLEFSNKMLTALKGIKANTDGLALALIQAGIADPKSLQNQGIKTGVTGVTAKSFDAGAMFGTTIFGANSGIGKLSAKISTAIFGGKTTAEIKDVGIAINGTLDALTEGTKGLVNQYTNLQTTVSGGWFRSDKVSNTVMTTEINKVISEQLTGMFSNIKDTVLAASESLGKDKGITEAIIGALNYTLKVSALGLKPEELAAAITAEISIAFNQAAEAAFPELAKFRKNGEEFGNTIVRLARDIQLTDLAFTSIGKTVSTLTGVAKVTAVEDLLKLTGGIDTFLTNTENFRTEFLTAAEQLAPVQEAVTKEMARLGLAGITTREAFAAVVKSLDLTEPAARQLYADLINVSGAFAEVHEETRKVLTVQELSKAQLSQQIEILTLLGKTSEALALTRADELAQLDPLLRAGKMYIYQLQDQNKTADLVVQLMEAQGDATGALTIKRKLEIRGLSDTDAALKTRIYRLQDETALKGKLKTAYDKESTAIKNTITGLKDSVKALFAYKLALKEGDKSVLNPQAKYEETKAEALRIATLANSIATTEAEKSDKQAAINQLPAATEAFLAASQIIYASSEQYTQDFNTVLDLISATTDVLGSQQTDAEKQLAALDLSVSSLGFIEDATQTTAELLQQLVTLQSTMYAADVATSAANAAGDYILPEAVIKQLTSGVDAIFSSAFSQIILATSAYSAAVTPVAAPLTTAPAEVNQTAVVAATNNALLLAQLKSLQDEVASLRADQQTQTGHLIQVQLEAAKQLIAAQQALAAAKQQTDLWNSRNSWVDDSIGRGG